MLTIALTRHPHARKELFLDKTLRVVSRSGLNPTEACLINHLPAIKKMVGDFVCPIFLGGRTGALAMAVWLRGEAIGSLHLHSFDAHTLDTFQRNLTENSAPIWDPEKTFQADGFELGSSLDLCAECGGSIAFWQMTRGDGTAELHLFMLEQLTSRAGVKFLAIAADEINETFLERFRKVCSNITLRREGTVTLLIGKVTKPTPVEKLPNHLATFEVSLKGHAPITLETWPGCFCHRRADMGGLALTEVVAEHVSFENGDRIMDMGCGCGMDGILLATAFADKKLHVTYQDSNASARDSICSNLQRYPHNADVIFSAKGEGDTNSYDLFLANPPYFGDWRIAEFFIATAQRVLKRGGLIAFVSKRETKPKELLEKAGFTILNPFPRRGYTILLAEKK